MKKLSLFLAISLFTCLSFAQTRNLKIVKQPTENPTIEKRKAVVIGMSDYGSREKNLPNALNDADDMAVVFARLGFEVTLLKNNDLQSLEVNLDNWYKTIERNDMAIFYFAGHGMKIKGVNYLIPVDFPADVAEANVKYKALRVDQVLDNMDEKQVGMKLLILDACQDNPFKRSWNRGTEEKGLAEMKAPTGIYILFSSWPGSTAQEGSKYSLRNGVFTHFLKQEIVKEGASIDEIINNVAGEVSNITGKQQMPYKSGILTKNFYFKPKTSDRPGELVKYYYYIDQNGNESRNRFEDRKTAENEMKSRSLYGKIYSNAGEVFVVEKRVEPPPLTNRFANFTETAGNLNLEMIAVQGGTFTMGCTSEQDGECYDNEKPAHQVTVSNFYIGKFEVTQAQWKVVMGSNPSYFKGDNLSVESVSWSDAQEFIRKLNTLTGKQYRLPTEAEWEFAARGGAKSQGYKYSGSNNLNNVAWFNDNRGSATHAVGTKSPNELGIYDMSGNVWEWCSDWIGNYSASAQRDPMSASSGTSRVVRGGSWDGNAEFCRVSFRDEAHPDDRCGNLGFRLACSL